MIILKIDFPAGRWHATAWGSHVNEGVPEWPPCPWRISRALIAAWYWKHQKDEESLRSLIEKLASTTPDYHLPPATAAHTRHYMPAIEGKKENKPKIFDAFVHVSKGESLWIRWDVSLDAPEKELLSTLLENLSYMGRAESLVSASLVDSHPPLTGTWTTPVDTNNLLNPEPIRLLAPQLPEDYAEWLGSQQSPEAKKAKSKKKGPSLPGSLFDALQLDTADWKKEGWNQPPGSRWVEYLRPRDCLSIAPRGTHNRRSSNLPNVARFAITSPVPPSITQALSLGERFHQALCKFVPDDASSPNLTGCDEFGQPLKLNEHAYFLPECNAKGYVTHMTAYAPGGFDEIACRAFGRLRKVWGTEGFDVQVVLLATGQPKDFALVSPYFATSKIWTSLTPFVPVRHPKASRAGQAKIDEAKKLQIGSPEHDCWRLLEIIAPQHRVSGVTSLGTRIQHGLRNIPCMDFQRLRRTGEGTRAGSSGYALRIEFETETSLPFGLGYGGHFGLGAFFPEESAE